MDPNEARAEARRAYMEGDFLPTYPASAVPPAPDRVANAAEYAAYQLGQINRTLKAILQAIEQKT